MPKRCQPCLGSDIKTAILREIRDPGVEAVVGKVRDCDDPVGIELCGKTGRARSAYQSHISTCMKAKGVKGFGAAGPALKQCAAEWRASKGKG